MHPASLPDLPFELIEQTTSQCDNTSLLALARVGSKYLNYMALREFYIREAGGPHAFDTIVIRSDGPQELLPALSYSAFWIQHISSLTFCLTDGQRVYSDMRSLIALISHLTSIGELVLNLDFDDARILLDPTYTNYYRGRAPRTQTTHWVQIIAALLEATSLRGCTSMEVRAPGVCIYDLVCYMPPPDTPTWRALGYCLTTWIRPLLIFRWNCMCLVCEEHLPGILTIQQAFQPRLKYSPRFYSSPPSITSLHIDQFMLLHAPVFAHTLNFINHHSPVLKSLKLTGMYPIAELVRALVQLFTHLNTPVLKTFVLKVSCRFASFSNITFRPKTFEVFIDFLARHPTIQSFELPDFHQPPSATVPARRFKSTILPNLKRLHALPHFVYRLLHDPSCCPELIHVCLTSHGEDQKSSRREDFDNALLAITSLSRPVRLQISFYSYYNLRDWVPWEIEFRADIWRQLQNISHITLYSTSRYAAFPEDTSGFLPQWFALFPHLESVAIVHEVLSLHLAESDVEAIIQANPNLCKAWTREFQVSFGRTEPEDVLGRNLVD